MAKLEDTGDDDAGFGLGSTSDEPVELDLSEIDFNEISPELQRELLSNIATQISYVVQAQALDAVAKIVRALPKQIIMSVLQGACAGLNRAVGTLEGDILGNLPPGAKSIDGETLEETLIKERERFRLLGREDREEGKRRMVEEMKKATESGSKIGFRMPPTNSN